jgi:hypothetical protein
MGDAGSDLGERVEDGLWPVVEDLVSSRDDLVASPSRWSATGRS